MHRLLSSPYRASQLTRLLSSGTDFKRVGIVGLGLMGHGVAQVTAQAGYQVVAIETSKEALDVIFLFVIVAISLYTYLDVFDGYIYTFITLPQAGMARIKGSLTKLVSKRVEKGEIVSSDASKYVDADYSRITPTLVMCYLPM